MTTNLHGLPLDIFKDKELDIVGALHTLNLDELDDFGMDYPAQTPTVFSALGTPLSAWGATFAPFAMEEKRPDERGFAFEPERSLVVPWRRRRRRQDALRFAGAQLLDFTGQFVALSKDQHGCRFLQRLMESAEAVGQVFAEIAPAVTELMVDPFGNYLVQKVLERGTGAQRRRLMQAAARDVLQIAVDPHGTRALQKMVEVAGDDAAVLVASLEPHVLALARDLNGNHVVQRCLECLGPQRLFVYDAAAAHCVEMATQRHGCCVLQRCLDHGSAAQVRRLSAAVAAHSAALAADPFGNYVVQYVLAKGDAALVAQVLQHVCTHVVPLLLHKFGLNVIEKALRGPHRDAVVAHLLAHAARFAALLNDAYGNYVLQTALDVAAPADLRALAAQIQPLLPAIKSTPHGRRIMAKIQNA